MNPKEFIEREQEIGQAQETFPGIEIGEAYRKWKKARGEVAVYLNTGDKSIEVSKAALKETAKKPCAQEGCSGTMELEAVCGGCVEGRLGFKSKWICDACLHRELSKKDFLEWLRELSSSSKE